MKRNTNPTSIPARRTTAASFFRNSPMFDSIEIIRDGSVETGSERVNPSASKAGVVVERNNEVVTGDNMTRFTVEIVVSEEDAHATRRKIEELGFRYAVTTADDGRAFDFETENNVESATLVTVGG